MGYEGKIKERSDCGTLVMLIWTGRHGRIGEAPIRLRRIALHIDPDDLFVQRIGERNVGSASRHMNPFCPACFLSLVGHDRREDQKGPSLAFGRGYAADSRPASTVPSRTVSNDHDLRGR